MMTPGHLRNTVLDSIQSYLIIWVLFFTPLVFLPFFEDPFRFSKIILFYFLTTLLVLSSTIKIFLENKFSLPTKPIIFSILFFVFTFFLSSLLSIHQPSSFFGVHQAYIGSFIHILALFIFTFSVLQIDWTGRSSQLSVYISAAAAIASVFALVQFSQYFYDFSQFYRVRSTIGEPNRLAYFLSASLPFCIFLFIASKQKWIKFASFINCLLVFTTILLTFSRSAWIGLLLTSIAIVFVFFLYFKKEIKPILEKFVGRNKFYLIVVMMLVAFFLPSFGKKVLERNLAIIEDLKTGGGSINIRLQNWQVVWKTIKNREKWHQHILGTGPSTVVYTFLKNRPSFLNKNPGEKDLVTITVRNQFLDLLANIGILGLVSFVAVLVVVLFYIFRNLKELTTRPIFWPTFTCFLTIFFTSFFYYQTITTSIYFWFSLGLLISFLKKQEVRVGETYRSSVLILGICLFVVFMFILTRVVLADFIFSKGDFKKAVSLNPYNDFYQRQLAYFFLREAEDKKDLEKAKLAIETAKEAVRLNNIFATNQQVLQLTNYRTGVIFDKKFHQSALEAGEKRIAQDPTHAGPYDTQGLIYLDLGELEEALEYFQKALEIDPDYLVSYLHIGESLKQMGKIDEAIHYYRLAVQKNPNWPFAQEELEKAEKLKSI